MNELMQVLGSKGIATAEDAIRELHAAGVLTGYDVSVYLAQQEFMEKSAGVAKPMCMLKDIAHKHSIGCSTLRNRISAAVQKSEPSR